MIINFFCKKCANKNNVIKIIMYKKFTNKLLLYLFIYKIFIKKNKNENQNCEIKISYCIL